MEWSVIYRLSINDTWLDFIDHLNRLIFLYQDSFKHKSKIFSSIQLEGSITAYELVIKLYEAAIETIQKEMFKAGAVIIDVMNFKDYSDKVFEHYVRVKSDYWNTIKEVDELIPALKVVIRSLDRRFKDSTNILRQDGFIINL